MQQPHFRTNITIQRNKLTSHEILVQNYKATHVIVNIHKKTRKLARNEGIICQSLSTFYLALLYIRTLQHTTGTDLKSNHEEYMSTFWHRSFIFNSNKSPT